MGCAPSTPLAEGTPLKVDKSGGADDRGGGTDFSSWKFAAPLAFAFYIAVVIVKTLTTKALLLGVKAPVALSALSLFVTALCCVPVFLVSRSQWGVPSPKNYKGLALVVVLLSLDMAFTNIAVSMLSVPIQQCLLATAPTFVVVIESVVRRKVNHPIIYATVLFICVGPVLTNVCAHGSDQKSGARGGDAAARRADLRVQGRLRPLRHA